MKATVSTEGFADFEQAMTELPRATGKGVLRRVGRQALRPMLEDAAARAPDDPSTPAPDLRSSLAISEKTSNRAAKAQDRNVAVTLYMGPTRDGYPEAMPQEFGSEPHYVSKNAARKGVRKTLEFAARKMHPGNPPRPFMRPAWDLGATPLLEALKGLLWAELDKARERLARKAERLAQKMRNR